METLTYTNTDLKTDLSILICQMDADNYRPTIIIGIARGGLVPAVMLSKWYGIPLYPLTISFRDQDRYDELEIHKVSGHKILVVDEICDTGKTLEFLDNVLPLHPEPARFAVLHHKAVDFTPNYYAHAIDKETWINYPWEKWWEK